MPENQDRPSFPNDLNKNKASDATYEVTFELEDESLSNANEQVQKLSDENSVIEIDGQYYDLNSAEEVTPEDIRKDQYPEEGKKKKEKKRRQPKNKVVFWIFFALALISWAALIYYCKQFYDIFMTFDMFPAKWGQWLLYGMIGVCAFTALFIFIPKILTVGKGFAFLLNCALVGALVFACDYLPSIRTNIEILFTEVPTKGDLEIQFYELKPTEPIATETTEENTEESSEETSEEPEINIHDYADKTFIVQKTNDRENQDYALKVLKRELEVDDVKLLEVDDLWQGVEAFYSGQGDIMVLNSSYVPVIENVSEYETFSDDTRIVYNVHKKVDIIDTVETNVTEEPFTVLIAGNDLEGEIVTDGRTDVNMMVTVNPKTKQVVINSMTRDAWIPNPAIGYMNDKLTHMGVMGIQNTMDALEYTMDEHIDYYVLVNFDTFVNIINAVGGIDIDNPYRCWTYKGYVEEGPVHFDGRWALAYVRERYSLENGDFDRNVHQQIVLKALIEKLTTVEAITHINDILESMQGMFVTNLTMNEIYSLAQMQLDDMARWNIVMYHVTGSTGMEPCASMGTINKFSIVYPNYDEINFIASQIDRVVAGEIVTQEDTASSEAE